MLRGLAVTERRTLPAVLALTAGATAVLLAGCSGSDADAAAAPASTTTSVTATTETTTTTVAPRPTVTPERLIDACKARGQYYAVPGKLFGVYSSDSYNAVKVVWDTANMAPAEFATQFVVTGSGTAAQYNATKAFSFRCLVATGTDASVLTFEVTPS
jgi:hypothetical protein